MTRPEHVNDDQDRHAPPVGSLDTLEPPLLPPVDTRADHARSDDRRTGAIRLTDGSEAVIAKRGTGGARAGIRREAEVIGAVGGTELVQLVELRDRAEVTELVLRDVGGASLAARLADPKTTATTAMGLLATTCETVARLHARGWGHGRIDAHHVLVTARGRIRLCSLRSAAPLDVDPTIARADRAALLRLVDDWTHSTAQRPHRRLSVGGLRARLLARRTHRLQDDPDPQVLARILRRAARAGDVPLRRSWRALTMVAVAAIGLVVAGRAVAGLAGTGTGTGSTASSASSSPSARSDTATPATDAPDPTEASVPNDDPGATTPNAIPDCPPGSTDLPDVDGDRCGDDVRIEDDVVVVADRRYRVGRPGDVVAVGDWDCDGTATAAVLQPSTGTVHVFSTWATDGVDASASELGDVDGAVDFAASTDCGPPQVVTASGAVVDVGGTP